MLTEHIDLSSYIFATSLALVSRGEKIERILKNFKQVTLDSCLLIWLYPPALETQYVIPAMWSLSVKRSGDVLWKGSLSAALIEPANSRASWSGLSSLRCCSFV